MSFNPYQDSNKAEPIIIPIFSLKSEAPRNNLAKAPVRIIIHDVSGVNDLTLDLSKSVL